MRCSEPLVILSRSIFIFLLSAVWAFGDVTLWLKPTAFYKNDLHIKDIASIKGAPYIGEIALTPKEYGDFFISQDDVRQALKRGFIDPSSFHFQGEGTQLLVKNITKEFLKEAIRDFIESRYQNIKVTSISFSWHPLKQKGAVELSLKIKSESFGHIYLTLFVKKNQKVLKKVPVTVRIEHFLKVAIAKRDIPKGKIITPEDIGYKEKRVYNSLQRWSQNVIGLVARRTIRAGQLIRPSMVMPNYIVKKRHTVKVIYQKGPIYIELLGFALQNGNKGDLIQVKNLSSNKVMVCKVLSNGVVQFVQ